MTMVYFDSHCHLNDPSFDAVEETVSACREAGIAAILCVGYDPQSSRKAVELAAHYPEIYAAVGVHPENLEGLTFDCLDEIKELAKNPKVVAIGEIGLDYHWYKDPEVRKAQHPWFIRQIDLANELGLPVTIHARDASEDMYAILKEHPVHAGAVLHCYSGSVEMMREFAKLGLYFGFDGPVTYKNAVTPKECVKQCPIDRLLVETDSPYLTPVPFRGKPNSPKFIPYIVEEMAKLREIDVETMNEALWSNFGKLFRVKHG